MATIIRKPNEMFLIDTSKPGKFCMTDREAYIAQKQYEEDTLQAIRIVSKEEEKIREDEEDMKRYMMMWRPTFKPEKTWYQKLKDKVLDAHESAVIWYEDWKRGEEPEKTFEEKVEEVRIRIVEDRLLQQRDPGYDC